MTKLRLGGATYFLPSQYLLDFQSTLTESEFSTEKSSTFFDSRRSPFHRWFPFVAGFSFASVGYSLLQNEIVGSSKTIIDPFVGSGTTLVAAKALGVKSIGMEAHPLLAFIASTKTFWDFDDQNLETNFSEFQSLVRQKINEPANEKTLEAFPEFVRKLYDRNTLSQLAILKESVNKTNDKHLRDLYTIALLRALRDTTYSKIDGIYIAPDTKKKFKLTVLQSLSASLDMMFADLALVRRMSYAPSKVINGDCRNLSSIEDDSIDFAYTSPPYLNNFDYAEMTRLELYFLDFAKDWKSITDNVRSKLLTNTTTQVVDSMRGGLSVDKDLPEECQSFIEQARSKLRELRKTKSGKKNYDIIVVKYFNEMHQHFREMYRVLRKGSSYIMTLGDSALYGVYIPTHEILRDIAMGVGFRDGEIEMLRSRGGKSNLDIAKRPRADLREVRLYLLR